MKAKLSNQLKVILNDSSARKEFVGKALLSPLSDTSAVTVKVGEQTFTVRSVTLKDVA